MHPNSQRIRNALVRAWSAAPASRSRLWGIWGLGLALGSGGFLATTSLPLTPAALLWLAMLGVGLLLLLRAEPVLSGDLPHPKEQPETHPIPPQPQAPSRPPPLLQMMPIRGGLFRMGSAPATEDEIREYLAEWAEALGQKPDEVEDQVKQWLQREAPSHWVQVSPFFMTRTPVTRGQWRALMQEIPDEWQKDATDQALPATHIDWPQALVFCNALSRREGLTPCYQEQPEGQWRWEHSAEGYRLPTEAEWESACRADTTTRWFWGETPDGADAHAWYRGNAEGQLQRVGEKSPNPWGLHDMAGLVFEWCWDTYGEYPNDQVQPPTDPQGPTEGNTRVVRGGSFDLPPDGLRSAYRGDDGPGGRLDDLGLRCVRSRVRQP